MVLTNLVLTNMVLSKEFCNRGRGLSAAIEETASHSTEVRFARFFSGGFITVIVVNPPERKLAKRTSV